MVLSDGGIIARKFFCHGKVESQPARLSLSRHQIDLGVAFAAAAEAGHSQSAPVPSRDAK